MSPLQRLFILGLVVFAGLQPSSMVAHAQPGGQTLIQYNTPVIVTLTPGQTVLRSFMVRQGDSFDIRLTPLSDYTYTAVLLDPLQQPTPLPSDGNSLFTVTGASQSGQYSLVLQSNSVQGELLILVSSTTQSATLLAVGETEVTLGTDSVRFHLEPPGLAGNMQLSIGLVPPATGLQSSLLPSFTLIESDTGNEVVSVRGSVLPGVSLTLPAQTSFVLVFEPGDTTLQLLLKWSEVPTTDQPAGQIPTPTSDSVLPTVTPITTQTLSTATGPCQVAFSGAVNIRNGPSTGHLIIGAGNPGTILPVTGRNSDSSWWQVNFDGRAGWVSNQIERVVTEGDCSAIPLASFPPPPTPTPTSTSTPTPSLTPTPVISPTPTWTETPVAVATLNFSLPPDSGSTSLTSGFVPDPYTVGMTSGGPVNVSYLGGGCSGFASSAPDFSVNYTAGAFPTLRLYFIGNADSTMIVNTPGGSYVCVDDSFGTLNPTIDFNSPPSGRYDVWIGSYAMGTTVSGTLYVTENTGNHP